METDPELLAEFVSECDEHLATVEDDVLRLERDGAEVDSGTVNHLFRSLHTVKGGASLMGFSHITEFAHTLENLVGAVRAGKRVPDKALCEALLEGTDKLRPMIASPDDGGLFDHDLHRALEALLQTEAEDAEPEAQSEEPAEPDGTAMDEAPEVPEPAPAEPARAKTAEDAPARIDTTPPETGRATEPPAVTVDQTVRIPLALLDKLMNLAGELVLVRNQNVQAMESRDLEQLSIISQQLNVVTSELQASVMQTRMRSIGSVFTKFNRIVRDLAHTLGKDIELEIVGSDVELDKAIVEAIGDPLTHLVRNAVDHGVETPRDRKSAGKYPVGHLRMHAFHEGGLVNIQIQDDGRGMDPAALKAAAVEKEILSVEQAEALTDKDALNLIFEPGFSTASGVTDLSGRGVGMDVVKTSFRRLGGTVDLLSTPGRGTTVTIKLPLTLAIVPTLIVAVEEHHFAIPQINIEEVVWLHGPNRAGSIKVVDQQEVYWLRGKLLPIIRLGSILGIPDSAPATAARKGEPIARPLLDGVYIIVLRLGREQFGLLVDTLVDTEEIVVKPLHEQLKDCKAFSGTTVLGDGHIAMTLDIAAVAELGELRFAGGEAEVTHARSSMDEQRTVLLFSIGGRERFAVPLCLIARVEEITPSQMQIANGREYLNFRNSLIPIVRIEQTIPRIETEYPEDLLHILIPKYRKPFGIVAARIIDTVEVEQEIDAKTICERGIVGSQLIDGQLTLFFDAFAAIETLEPDWFADDAGRQAGEKHALLIDDSPFSLLLMTSYLHGTGLTLTTAENGREGIELLRKRKFDVVICDIEMPIMDGYAFARSVREQENCRDLPMLAVSGAGGEIRPLALDAGFNGFWNKFDQKGLLEALARLCQVPVSII